MQFYERCIFIHDFLNPQSLTLSSSEKHIFDVKIRLSPHRTKIHISKALKATFCSPYYGPTFWRPYLRLRSRHPICPMLVRSCCLVRFAIQHDFRVVGARQQDLSPVHITPDAAFILLPPWLEHDAVFTSQCQIGRFVACRWDFFFVLS
jgi:hypothetical protein